METVKQTDQPLKIWIMRLKLYLLRNQTPMKFKFYSLCFLFCFTCFCKAQDTIKLRDGSKQSVRILEVSSGNIKYKREDNPSGPTFVLPTTEIWMIVYRNGSKEIYDPTIQTGPVSTSTTAAGPKASGPVKFSGPRVGCTYIGAGTASKWITDQGKTPFVSQIGWQLETR